MGGDEEPSKSSSDESIKSTTTRINKGALSSSNKCHMAKGTDSNVSDDDSDSSSIKDLLDLVREHQEVIRKQSREIKNLNALNDLNAIFATNYESLLCKFKLLSEEHEGLKLKIESINNTNYASTSYFDKSNPCNKKYFEDVVVESCDDLIPKENDELKKEV